MADQEIGGVPPAEEAWLAVRGSGLADAAGRDVVLRGVGIGGWLNMENFITGYAGSEQLHRRTLRQTLGTERSEHLFESLLSAFFSTADARFLASLGVNAVRIPVNYRHLEGDDNPGVIDEAGFGHLDRAVAACAEVGIYTVIDLHSLPGAQNHHWHSDNPFHLPQLWEQRHYQERTVAIWRAIAEHYHDQPWVAGYNLINEPAAENPADLAALHAELTGAVRDVDPRHVLFLDGNRYSWEFEGFGEPSANTVYAVHQYPAPGSVSGGPYPGTTAGVAYDKHWVEQDFRQLVGYMETHGVPVWVGEFGPVYTGEPEADRMRRELLCDQLDVFAEHGAGWSLWTYKDIGLQGLVHARADSPWMRRTRGVREKKARLGVDAWGSTDEGIADIMDPLLSRLGKEFPDFDPYPFGQARHAQRLVRGILLAEPLCQEFAEAFSGVSADEAAALGRSFAFEECDQRRELCDLVAAACGR